MMTLIMLDIMTDYHHGGIGGVLGLDGHIITIMVINGVVSEDINIINVYVNYNH